MYPPYSIKEMPFDLRRIPISLMYFLACLILTTQSRHSSLPSLVLLIGNYKVFVFSLGRKIPLEEVSLKKKMEQERLVTSDNQGREAVIEKFWLRDFLMGWPRFLSQEEVTYDTQMGDSGGIQLVQYNWNGTSTRYRVLITPCLCRLDWPQPPDPRPP